MNEKLKPLLYLLVLPVTLGLMGLFITSLLNYISGHQSKNAKFSNILMSLGGLTIIIVIVTILIIIGMFINNYISSTTRS